ncbi:MAG: M48 family metalloprotease [Ramlibacter sp.]|nr:M48 family metalloprotease [Ramlibacter sp.]
MKTLPACWMRMTLACIASLASAGAAAADRWAQLAYEPVALAWSAGEVERATAGNFDDIVRRAKGQGQYGCETSCERVRRVFERLVPLARAQTPRARHLPWTLTVVRTPGVEALALPGGQVVISEAFIHEHRMPDAQLAFVLAHEMAHSILEHERQTLHFARMLLRQDVPRSVADMYVEMGYNFALLSSLEPVMQQGEFEADELGFLLASAAGYAPRDQIGFMARQAVLDKTPRALVHTHPPARERLAQLRARLPLAQRLYAAHKAQRR